jgi:hypothetical protein
VASFVQHEEADWIDVGGRREAALSFVDADVCVNRQIEKKFMTYVASSVVDERNER